LVITIDGPAGVGKSTAAKMLAKRLGLQYLDTGATYRTLAYAALQDGLHPVHDEAAVARLAQRLPLALRQRQDGSLQVLLDGADVSRAIRTEEVSEASAQISQSPAVRAAMVRRQRELADRRGVVVEGRDTGSVVFPRATMKFFLDAEAAIRARRRQRELSRLYGTRLLFTRVQEQLRVRDRVDRTRRVGPLVKPRGAVAIDTSRLTIAQVVRRMLEHIPFISTQHTAHSTQSPPHHSSPPQGGRGG
jgi:cytidylate kinase